MTEGPDKMPVFFGRKEKKRKDVDSAENLINKLLGEVEALKELSEQIHEELSNNSDRLTKFIETELKEDNGKKE
jgi:hypothetical protein